MKKLMTFCFVVLLTVLSVLSCLNFNIKAQEQVELDKTIIQIIKPDGLANADFLSSIDNSLASLNADIMYRYVRENEGKTEYCYFKTNHTEDFLDVDTSSGSIAVDSDSCISTREYTEYQTAVLRISALTQDISFFEWEQAEQYDLNTANYYVKAEQAETVLNALHELGYEAVKNNSIAISTQFSTVLFSFVPAFMVVVSMIFYTLSNGKKNVLKKMEGYSTLDILISEVKQNVPAFLLCIVAIEVITTIIAVFLYPAAIIQFIAFSAPNLLIAFAVLLVGGLTSALFVTRQKSSEHIKGKAPKTGIYVTTIFTKCVFVVFVMIFLTIAIRNVSTAFSAFQTSKYLSEQVQGYVTVPVNNSNISYEALSGMSKQYEDFYMSTVDQYNGVLIDTSNYNYDLISGTSNAEKYGQDEIIVNRNYLAINPVYDMDGVVIDDTLLSDEVLNVLIPDSKLKEIEKYRDKLERSYDEKVNFISYDTAQSIIYAYNAEAPTTIDAPLIVVMDNRHISNDSAFIQGWCSQNSYFLYVPGNDPYAELKPILEETGVAKATVSTPSVRSTFAEVVNHQLQMLLIYGTQSAVLILGLFCLVVFSSKLYCENYKRKIACCLIDGYSLGKCVKKHWIITVCCYAVIGLLLFAVAQMGIYAFELGLLLIAFVCEIVIIALTSSRFTTKKLYQIVKGAE